MFNYIVIPQATWCSTMLQTGHQSTLTNYLQAEACAYFVYIVKTKAGPVAY